MDAHNKGPLDDSKEPQSPTSPTSRKKKSAPPDSTSFSSKIQAQAIEVIIALRLSIELNQPDLLENLHLVKMGQLINMTEKKDYARLLLLLTPYYAKYITPFFPEEKLQAYGCQLTRLKNSVRIPELFKEQSFTDDKENFATISTHLSTILSFLEKLFPQNNTSNTQKATEEEEENLLNFYYHLQLLRQYKYHNFMSYQQQDTMFAPLDQAIFEMIKLNQYDLVKKLLAHRVLLVAYLLQHQDSIEKMQLVETLSHATAEVIETLIPTIRSTENITQATEINAAAARYYTECVESHAALSADSLGKKIIKSLAAIAVGLLICALVLLVTWVVAYCWCGVVLTALSWQIQAGTVATASCLLLISGFFSHRQLRGKGCLDSDINQSTKAITQNVRQIASTLPS